MPVRLHAFLLMLLAVPAAGQLFRGGDQLTLTIDHPPLIQAPLEHIAFTQPQGPCSEQFSDALVADFSTSGAIVIDRLHLKNIIAEHKLNSSGLIDSKTAAKIGRLIGTGSLVFVKIHECKIYHTMEVRSDVDLKGDIHKNPVPTTRGTMRASVQLVNMTNGVTIAAHVVDAKAKVHSGDKSSMKEKVLSAAASLRRQGGETAIPYPPDDDVQSELFATAVRDVHRALFRWRETKKVTFYNDRECGLNNASVLLQTANYEGAARAAQESVETCQRNPSVKPAAMARAHYNQAMTLFFLEDYSGAMKSLAEAARFETNKAITDAMAETNRVWSATQIQNLGKKTANPPKKAASPTEDKLRQLDDLYKKKLITEEEYAKKRKEILDTM